MRRCSDAGCAPDRTRSTCRKARRPTCSGRPNSSVCHRIRGQPQPRRQPVDVLCRATGEAVTGQRDAVEEVRRRRRRHQRSRHCAAILLYFLSRKDASHFRILSTPLAHPDVKHPRIDRAGERKGIITGLRNREGWPVLPRARRRRLEARAGRLRRAATPHRGAAAFRRQPVRTGDRPGPTRRALQHAELVASAAGLSCLRSGHRSHRRFRTDPAVEDRHVADWNRRKCS